MDHLENEAIQMSQKLDKLIKTKSLYAMLL